MAQVIWTQKIAFYQSESLTEKGEKVVQIVQLFRLLSVRISNGKRRKTSTNCGTFTLIRKPVDSVMSTIDKTNHNTRDTIANDLGWSTGKVAMGKISIQ